MEMKFDKKQLKADILVLEGKGIETEVAENIAQFKQAVEYASCFIENFGFVEEDEVPEEVSQHLDYANTMLEDAWWEVAPIFEKEAVAVAAAA